MYKRINDQLKLNRRLLAAYNKSGKSTVRRDVIQKEGFNPRIFTHFWKAENGNTYLFVYDQGYMGTTENGKEKYVLIQWQGYMGRSLGI